MPWQPDVTVACVVERAGRFLMVEERVQGRLVVNQPAGHLDPNESLVEAAVRETLEETAWHVRPTGLVAVYQWRNESSQGRGDDASVVRFTFAAEPLRQEPGRELDDGIVRALWLDERELASGAHVLRTPMVLQSVLDFRRRPPFALELLSEVRSAVAQGVA